MLVDEGLPDTLSALLPLASAAARDEASAADTVFPSAACVAIWTADCVSASGTVARAASSVSSTVARIADTGSPRRSKRCRRRARPCSNRRRKVPNDKPSCRTASSRVQPSSEQSTNGARHFSGNRHTSSSSRPQSSRPVATVAGSSDERSTAGLHWWERRSRPVLILNAKRWATR